MKSESEKILSMLEEGAITAEEADELLETVEETPAQPAEEFPTVPPDMDQIRNSWRMPFNISLILATISGSLLWRSRRASGIGKIIRTLLLLPIAALSALTAVILYLTQNGPWLHLRIRSAEGERLTINLPFPLNWVRSGLEFAQTQIPDEEAQGQLEMAAEFLEAIETSNLQDPLSVNVRDDGENIDIFFVQ